MSRTDEKGAGGLSESADAQDDDGERGESTVASESSMTLVRSRTALATPEAECPMADEAERTRLMGDIMQLIRDTSMPEATRAAGLTLVGWLARRRSHEVPHAIGVDEARESERRLRIARTKAR